jgi:hypothetical protein
MFTYTYEHQDVIQIALKRLPGPPPGSGSAPGGAQLKKGLSVPYIHTTHAPFPQG